MNEMTRANVRANQLDTLFGRLWNVINPLLMGLVYPPARLDLGARGDDPALLRLISWALHLGRP